MKNQSVNHRKYSDAYISYVENGYSAAVFIIRDTVQSISTKGMWIDVLQVNGTKNKHGQWDFTSITVALVPRKTKPFYPQGSNQDDIKYITWKTAMKDIGDAYLRGYRGKRYTVQLKLVNLNQGQTHVIERIYSPKFGQYIHPKAHRPSDCVVRKERVPVKPKWEYQILSVKELEK